ncbi:MAG: hypothetical protein JWR26_4984 [Pedosphaera sp.]|nr:hypothetical protein [Pedosphaera sp.]
MRPDSFHAIVLRETAGSANSTDIIMMPRQKIFVALLLTATLALTACCSAHAVCQAPIVDSTNQPPEIQDPSTPAPQTNVEKLRKYETANPTNDFAADLKNNDIHFMAVRGYSVTVPGLNESKPKLPRKVPWKIIDGTSDYIRTNEEIRLNRLATEYAKNYNQLVLDYLNVKPKSEAWVILENYSGVYAFGGVGIAGIPTRGEIALWDIYNSPNAAQQLVELFPQCEPSGKAYVLAALYHADKKAFQPLADAFCKEPGFIGTARGCNFSSETRGELVAEMQSTNSIMAFNPSKPRPERH